MSNVWCRINQYYPWPKSMWPMCRACMATMGILYYRLALQAIGQELPDEEQRWGNIVSDRGIKLPQHISYIPALSKSICPGGYPFGRLENVIYELILRIVGCGWFVRALHIGSLCRFPCFVTGLKFFVSLLLVQSTCFSCSYCFW